MVVGISYGGHPKHDGTAPNRAATGHRLDWIVCQHSIGYMGDGFYRSKDPTNSIKVLKEKLRRDRQTGCVTNFKVTHRREWHVIVDNRVIGQNSTDRIVNCCTSCLR